MVILIFISQQVPSLSAAPSAVPPAPEHVPAAGGPASHSQYVGGDGIRVYGDGSHLGARQRDYNSQSLPRHTAPLQPVNPHNFATPQHQGQAAALPGQPPQAQVRQPGIPQYQPMPPSRQQQYSGSQYQSGHNVVNNAAAQPQPSLPPHTPAPFGQQFGQPQVGQHQQPGVSQQQQAHQQAGPILQDTTQYSYDWVTDSAGRQTLMRTPLVQQQPSQHRPAPQQYRTEFRCSPTTGTQWSIQVPVTSNFVPSPQAVHPTYEWRINPNTGVRYQVQIQANLAPAQHSQLPVGQPQARPQASAHGQQYHQVLSPDMSAAPDQAQQLDTLIQDHSANTSLTRHERVAGIVSLLDGVEAPESYQK